MNIFVLHNDPRIAAAMMCDKHIPKMVLESCQLLSTAHRLLDGEQYKGKSVSGKTNVSRWKLPDEYRDSHFYQAGHVNHPCSIWTRSRLGNYFWLTDHAIALCAQYELRFGKKHACLDLANSLYQLLPDKILGLPHDTAKDDFAQAMPDSYKDSVCAVQAYRTYYVHEKSRFAYWRPVDGKPNVPWWFWHECKKSSIKFLNDSPELDKHMEATGPYESLYLFQTFNKP